MTIHKLVFGLAMITTLCFACKSTYDIRKPNGIQSILKELGGNVHDVELLTFDSNILYVLNDGRFQKFKIVDIQEIYTYELENKGRKPILIFGGIGIIAAGVGLIGDDENRALGIITTGMGISFAIAGGSHMPKYKFRPPWEPGKMVELKLYCRFPQGLTQSELDYLESYYNQAKF